MIGFIQTEIYVADQVSSIACKEGIISKMLYMKKGKKEIKNAIVTNITIKMFILLTVLLAFNSANITRLELITTNVKQGKALNTQTTIRLTTV